MGTWSLVTVVVCAQMANASNPVVTTGIQNSVATGAVLKTTPPLHEQPTIVQMLAANNRLRASVGRAPQTLSPALTKAAQDHAWYMARTGDFSHHSNGGPSGRAARHGFGGLASENIAMGQPTVSSVFQSWRTSSGHWANIISSARVAGFGYAVGSDGNAYWVGMYGN
jgi:uncharacterized protein YkwD